ncbi:MAG: seryl-tRNA synthetase, partial [Solirubrobacteraceae bacterium]|nr:seryl-tRNA synthetase [Solirubrobacteraceae bacterium]
MLDLKRIREDPDGVSAALARRDESLAGLVGEVLQADEQWRAATTAAETLRAEQKARSEEFARARERADQASQLRAAMQQLSAQVKQSSEQAAAAKQRLDELVARLPNLPDPTAASGPEDEEMRTVGEPPSFSFQPRDHLELAGSMIDMDRAAKLSGSRFAYLKGDLVMVELALVGWVLAKLRQK